VPFRLPCFFWSVLRLSAISFPHLTVCQCAQGTLQSSKTPTDLLTPGEMGQNLLLERRLHLSLPSLSLPSLSPHRLGRRLRTAVARLDLHLVAALVQTGADMASRDARGHTALHEPAASGRPGVRDHPTTSVTICISRGILALLFAGGS